VRNVLVQKEAKQEQNALLKKKTEGEWQSGKGQFTEGTLAQRYNYLDVSTSSPGINFWPAAWRYGQYSARNLYTIMHCGMSYSVEDPRLSASSKSMDWV
jgi:hypothetical protein